MPNDAKVGLFVGVVVVIALAVIYHGKGPDSTPEGAVQAPKRLATPAQPNLSTLQPTTGLAVQSLAFIPWRGGTSS